ncbi:MAG: family 43 glycosylhydrolase [Spirochaetales bacterium]|nr:family 43 glycosylhydrolase [Spirochaetales bacterium]
MIKNERKKNSKFLLAFILLLALSGTALFAANPIVSGVYTADPNAFIGGDGKLYVICSHDIAGATGYDQLKDYILLSTDDMINWQNHGVVFNAKSVAPWANLAYAPGMIYRDGTYYLYFPNGASNIGVATSSSPTGPWRDPVGRAIIDRNTPGTNGCEWIFDPGAFLDDDGTGYVYYGGGGPGNARVIKLNSSLTGVSGSAATIDAPRYFEAPYVHKRNSTYYFTYSTDFSGSPAASIDYMTSSNPMTGFQHRGTVLNNPWSNLGNNNHQSIVEYGGRWFMFYHNRALSNSVYQRSVCVDELFYNSDGTMKRVNDTQAGITSPVNGETEAPTPTPTATPSPDPNANIVVRAMGTVGGELLEIHVNGTVVSTITLTTEMADYYASGSGQISIYFTNDDNVDSGMDVQLDRITYNGEIFEAEDQAVNTAVWQDSSCGGSNSEWMHCSGYIEFATGPVETQTPPTPTPTPVADAVLGYNPSSIKILPGTSFTVSVTLSTESSTIAAYGIDIIYDSNYLSVDTSTQKDGVIAGADGYLAAANPNETGKISVTGFDVNGVVPGDYDDFLKVFLKSGSREGTCSLDIAVNNLTTNSTAEVSGVSSPCNVEVTNDIGGCALTGDGNGDGVVNIVDALLAAQVYVGIGGTAVDTECLDANCDGTVNIVDALLIAQYYVGSIDNLC